MCDGRVQVPQSISDHKPSFSKGCQNSSLASPPYLTLMCALQNLLDRANAHPPGNAQNQTAPDCTLLIVCLAGKHRDY